MGCSIFKSNNTLQIENNEAILDNYFPSEQGKEVYRTVGKMPKYPGEEVKLFKYLGKNIKCLDSKKGFFHSSKIYTRFVVEKDGSISNVKAYRPMNDSCENEDINALKSMPRWIPGEHKNKFVRVSYALLIFVD
jgi:protein TonB